MATTLRRSSAKLRSLGSGHSDLVLAISQWKELRTATKAVIAAQESTANDLLKWSSKEDNRAIKDVVERFSELMTFWNEAMRSFSDDLKEVRHHFEMIYEGEKGVDSAKAQVDAADTKEVKLRKEEKKLKKRSNLDAEELREVQAKIVKVQQDRDYAESEAKSKVTDHELVKMIRVQEALKRLCNGQLQLAEKNKVVFSAGNEILDQMPELSPDTLENNILSLNYVGSAKTTQIVLRAKDALQKKREDSPTAAFLPPSQVLQNSNSTVEMPSSPPAYDDILRQPPINPYYASSPDSSFNMGATANDQSPSYLYPCITKYST